MMRRLLTITLGLALFTLPTAGRLDDSLPSEETFFGKPYLAEDQIESVLSAASDLERLELLSTLEGDEETLLTVLQGLERIAESKLQGEAGQLGPDGCAAAWTSHEESIFATTDDGVRPTMKDLFSAAGRVLFARVEEVQSVILRSGAGRLGTLIRVQILEDLAKADARRDFTGPAAYLDSRYSFDVGETVVCASRPGFHEPKAGDHLAILMQSTGYFEEHYSGSLWVANVFPIEDGVIQPQPYTFLKDEMGLTVEEARTLRARVKTGDDGSTDPGREL